MKTNITLSRHFRMLIVFCLLLVAVLQADALNFTFTLNASHRTSASAFRSDGTLIRTIWKNRTFNAGTYTESWDERDDYGNAVPAGTYEIRLTYHNAEYVWEGVIGNTSRDQTGFNGHRSLVFAQSMAIAGSKVYYSPYDNEAQPSFFSFDPNNAQVVTPHNQNRTGGPITYMDADDNFLYMAHRSPGFVLNPKDAFVVARSLSNLSFKTFSSGQYLCNWRNADGGCSWDNGHEWPSVIDRMTGSQSSYQVEATGLAVQRNGNFLFVSHGGVNEFHVLNKNTGQLVQNISMGNPGDIAAERNGNSIYVIVNEGSSRVVKKYTVNSNGTLSETRTISGLSKPLAVGITPDDATVAIVDGGASQQVKAYSNSSGSSVWTLGQPGGFANNPNVANDRFDFTYTEWSFVEFQPDGSFWICSAGDRRMIHFSASRQHIQTIQYMSASYVISVDPKDPTRVFNEFLEFKVDYSKSPGGTNGSWQYVKNWAPSLPASFRNRGPNWQTGFNSIQTLSNGKTYGTCEGNNRVQALFELSANGSRDTQVRGEELRGGIYPDGSMRYTSRSNNILYFYKRAVTGFDGSGNPIYSSPQVMAQAPAPTGNEPFFAGTFPFYKLAKTSGGVITTFREQGPGDPFHLGGVKEGANVWHFKASRDISTSAAPPWNGDFPTQGSNGVGYQAHIHDVSERNIVFAYHGESWGQGQANQYMHYLEDGTFIGQFGVPNHPSYLDARVGVAGNVSTIALVKVGDKTYLYTNDESNHGGVHRWLLRGTENIRTLTGQGGKGSSIQLSGSTGPVIVTGVSVSPTSVPLAIGATQQLIATVSPSNATNKSVTWSSSNSSVATVNTSGLVTGVSAGTATITVTTVDQGKTATATITVTANPAPGDGGTGLRGEYFNNMTLTGTSVLTRTDATVNFNWGAASPATGVNADGFSVRWSGQVQPQYSETYTFYTNSDDGIRLWVNNVQLINNWTNHAPTENSGTITLTAGTKYDIRMEFYENAGGAVAQLSWSSASRTKQIIPQSQLFPSASTPPPAPVEYSVHTTQVPAGSSSDSDYELGMKFQANVAGRITKIRYYKMSGETGTHTGRIWSATGTQLASVTFAGESASGWQTATLATPLTIQANTTYVVSVNSVVNYALTQNVFGSAMTNGPLSSIVGSNGVYHDTPGSFPTGSWNNSDYFRDVVFEPTYAAPRMATQAEPLAVEMYPNTTTDYVVIENSPENTTVLISDLNGRKIHESRISGSATIALTGTPPGMYIVKFITKSGGVTEKRLIVK